MASGVAGSSRGGRSRYQRRNYGLEAEVDYTNEYVRMEDIASAEGVKLRLPKARSCHIAKFSASPSFCSLYFLLLIVIDG